MLQKQGILFRSGRSGVFAQIGDDLVDGLGIAVQSAHGLVPDDRISLAHLPEDG